MKLKEGFILQKVAGENIAVPTGEGADLDMMITLNNVGAFLWTLLEEETDEDALAEALMEEYGIDRDRAHHSVQTFVEKLRKQDFME